MRRADDDPFYTHDEFGRPLDPASIRRRQFLKQLRHMPPEEFKARLIRLGIIHPDGTLTEHYCDNGEPSAHRPTD
jgi:hypothetical protein